MSARVLGGSRLHAVLSVLLVLDLVATVLVAVAGAPSDLIVLPFSAAVLFILWAFGAVAQASCEADGVAWRYVVQRTFRWSDIHEVRLTSARRSFFGSTTRPVIVVVVGRFDYEMAPADGVAHDRLVTFAHRLIDFAAARGVSVEVDARHWPAMGTASSSSTTDEVTP